MNRMCLLFCCWLLAGAALAQSSGVIEYEITRKVDGNRIRIITIDGSGGPGGRNPMESNTQVITLKQELLFTPGLGRLKEARPGFAPPPGVQMNIVRPFEEQSFIDFNSRRFLNYLKGGTGTDSSSYFVADTFQLAASWEPSKKTRDILGYSCKRASATWKDKKYTIWYTDALGLTFSPVNGLTPPEGFVLAIEGEDMAYEAKRIDKQEIPLSELIPPAGAKEVSAEELQAQRKRFIEQMASSRQGQPGFQIIRNN